MKFVKKSISLLEEAHKWALECANRESEEQGRPVGVSNIITNLLLEAKRRDEKQAQKKASA